MKNEKITYQNSGYFIPIINDYLDQKPSLESFYNLYPKIENFQEQIDLKRTNYNKTNTRKILASVLKKQYQNIELSDLSQENLNLIENENTFTITTGHQLNLFTGPLYFLYKIISTINLCNELKSKYPNQNFVPIYWMATEDHDFEEVNYFNFKNTKNVWTSNQIGAVGRFSLDGIDAVFENFNQNLGENFNVKYLKDLFQKSYLEHKNLSDATRYLVNELFGKHGLVILDADNQDLKGEFIPYIKDELLNQSSFEKVTETISKLNQYDIQVNPRKINLFYLTDNSRERIIFDNYCYKINNTKIEFSEAEILKEVETNPEKFSPNVILRPLYQELILPNLCYIGGGGELAYWFELKGVFDYHKITFPKLLLRNSAVIISEKQLNKIEKLDLTIEELFLKQNDLINNQIKKISKIAVDFSELKQQLSFQFENLYKIANQTDTSFLGALKAQEKKQLNGLANLEKRLLKAEKKANAEILNRIIALQNEIFPNQSLQERQINFSEFYLEYGEKFIEKLMENLHPLDNNFEVIVF